MSKPQPRRVDRAGARGRAFLDGGARFIQLRAKQLPSGAFLKRRAARGAARASYGAAVVINDRVDIARWPGPLACMSGRTISSRRWRAKSWGLPPSLVSPRIRSRRWTPRFTRPVTYIAIGPVFGTRSKATGYDAVGLDLVAQTAARAGSVPVVAIGGITLDTASRVISGRRVERCRDRRSAGQWRPAGACCRLSAGA